jgi:DNA-binding NarL/FixJ family response regulator
MKTEILLVEDNKLFRETLYSFINDSENYFCKYAFPSCEEALNSIESDELNPKIILLDIGLPGMSGTEGILHFKKVISNVKIIMLTIQDDDESVFNSICNGASGYLLKDSHSDKIIEGIDEVINGGAPMNSSIAAKVLEMFKEFAPQQIDYNLTQREKEILKYLVEGNSKKQIAEIIFLSYHTVDSHIRKIYEKLEVHSSSSAVAKALREKII